MKCLFCDEEIDDSDFYNLLIEEDKLCRNCRNKMKYHHGKFKREDLMIEYFYEYNSLFKDILLQYKECYDEALKDVFLYRIGEYIKFRYHGYRILYVPSSKEKTKDRGFNHLKEIFDPLHFEEAKGLRMIEDINQVGKNFNERKKMETNYIYEGERLEKVLIVDDVYTTGSSLMGVYRVVKPFTKHVKAIILGINKLK